MELYHNINLFNLCCIFANPQITGHAFIKPGINIYKKAKSEYENICKDFSEIAFFNKFKTRISELTPNHPITLSIKECAEFQIRIDNSQSDRWSLKGKIFKVEYMSGREVRLFVTGIVEGSLKDYSPYFTIVQHTAYLTGLVVFACFASFILVPSICIGIVVKSLSCRYFNPYKRTLSIKQITVEEYPNLGKIMREWQRVAGEKSNQSSKDKIELFQDCGIISKLVAQCFECPNETRGRVFNEAYLCKDSLNLDQGIILLKEDAFQVKIAHLVTHPQNIRSFANIEEFERAEGVGTALVDFAARRCLQSNKYLYLEGIKSAETFYQRYGFEKIENPIFVEDGEYAMQMSVEKIRQHFQKVA